MKVSLVPCPVVPSAQNNGPAEGVKKRICVIITNLDSGIYILSYFKPFKKNLYGNNKEARLVRREENLMTQLNCRAGHALFFRLCACAFALLGDALRACAFALFFGLKFRAFAFALSRSRAP